MAEDTMARWIVKEGREAEFQRIRHEDLGRAILGVGLKSTGTLLRSVERRQLFGPWKGLEEATIIRSTEVQAAIGRIRELCDEVEPGAYEVVARM
jgi:hypothetical protein